MRLKVLTATFLASVVLLLAMSPAVLGPTPPRGASHAAVQKYAKRSLIYLGVLVAFFTGSAVGATLIVRRQREEYRQEMLNNMRDLIEGSLRDVRKDQDGDREAL